MLTIIFKETLNNAWSHLQTQRIKHLQHCATTMINLNMLDFLFLKYFSLKQSLPKYKIVLINLEN